ncbi:MULTISPECIES: hypothetical protein [unclassified Nocardiopsis]|uniref:hypothetical protein n=1 Tax=Nocardiopsis TaxID=2013 RepID=UPI00387A9D86
MDRKPRVIGLDLSLTSPAIALPNGDTHTLKPTSKGDLRLTEIRDSISDLIVQAAEVNPFILSDEVNLAVIEDLPTHAKSAGITGMVHGIVRGLLIDHAIPFALIAPATLKAFATGKGSGDKTPMAIAALKRAGREFEDDKGGDQCDAWWLRAAGLQWLGHPIVDLPAAQVARLDKAKWPELAVPR